MELLQSKYAVLKQILDGEQNGELFKADEGSMMSEIIKKWRRKV